MSSVIISTSRSLGFPTRGILAVSTSAPLRCTTMHGERRRKNSSGCPWQEVAGESTGNGRIAQLRSLEMLLRIDLPAFLLDIVTDGR